MKTFLKANIAAIIATCCDYVFTFIMVELMGADKIPAGIGGTVAGGVINFFICRHWAFKAANGKIFHQGKKYFFTWAGNLMLNAAGFYLFINYAGIDYMLAKVITSLTVALAYNYPLQKRYVFKNIQ
ncbi:MAG: GtrA family protein [Chitinophagaceae bacterium]|nr:GtrA family protein [Chitinophagaceae bacterium]